MRLVDGQFAKIKDIYDIREDVILGGVSLLEDHTGHRFWRIRGHNRSWDLEIMQDYTLESFKDLDEIKNVATKILNGAGRDEFQNELNIQIKP